MLVARRKALFLRFAPTRHRGSRRIYQDGIVVKAKDSGSRSWHPN
jgi:hypothetical protein